MPTQGFYVWLSSHPSRSVHRVSKAPGQLLDPNPVYDDNIFHRQFVFVLLLYAYLFINSFLISKSWWLNFVVFEWRSKCSLRYRTHGVKELVFSTQNECCCHMGLRTRAKGNCRSTHARIWSVCRLIYENFKMGESIVLKTVQQFTRNIMHTYGDQYLRTPNEHDISQLLAKAEQRAFLVW